MALRRIIGDEDDRLRKKSRPVENFDRRLHILLDDMRETMYDRNGLGLAAVQVGVLRRAIVIDVSDDGNKPIELINPRIVSREGEQDGREGCLSYPGEYGMVVRPMRVVFEARDRNGKKYRRTAEGLFARAVCHEIDHLEGIVFKDLARDVRYIGTGDGAEEA